ISITAAVMKSLYISSGAHSSFNHDLEPFIKTLEISPKAIQILEIHDVPVAQLKLAGVLETGLYYFGNLALNRLEVRYFVTRGRVRFDNHSTFIFEDGQPNRVTEPSLQFANSDLGQTRFSQFDFTRFARVEINDCNFTQVESSDSEWFSETQLK